ncbi:Transcription factor TFIIIB component B'' [Smittium mucronatum]|uniref:Transcription factor TFIIIB component B n=1 Tax=Smittium mucronatum TaxID=133383 RepID=A0A1R0GZI3_9FUNG|nr:Transcription factor TFIIIB component B'' [Smittium mucronatum]
MHTSLRVDKGGTKFAPKVKRRVRPQDSQDPNPSPSSLQLPKILNSVRHNVPDFINPSLKNFPSTKDSVRPDPVSPNNPLSSATATESALISPQIDLVFNNPPNIISSSSERSLDLQKNLVTNSAISIPTNLSALTPVSQTSKAPSNLEPVSSQTPFNNVSPSISSHVSIPTAIEFNKHKHFSQSKETMNIKDTKNGNEDSKSSSSSSKTPKHGDDPSKDVYKLPNSIISPPQTNIPTSILPPKPSFLISTPKASPGFPINKPSNIPPPIQFAQTSPVPRKNNPQRKPAQRKKNPLSTFSRNLDVFDKRIQILITQIPDPDSLYYSDFKPINLPRFQIFKETSNSITNHPDIPQPPSTSTSQKKPKKIPTLMSLSDYQLEDPEVLLQKPMAFFCSDSKTGKPSKSFVDRHNDLVKKKSACKPDDQVSSSLSNPQVPEKIESDTKTPQKPDLPQPSNNTAAQIRVVDGKIVIDEESLVINRSQLYENHDNSFLQEIDETDTVRMINGFSFLKRKFVPKRWTAEETILFYKKLKKHGCDFDAISVGFEGRSRAEIKKKFKNEEKRNPSLVDIALYSPCYKPQYPS